MSDLIQSLKNVGCLELVSNKRCKEFLALMSLNKDYYRFGQYCHTPKWSQDLSPHRFHIIPLSKTQVTVKEKAFLFIKALIWIILYFAIPLTFIRALSPELFFSKLPYGILLLATLVSFCMEVNIKRNKQRENYLLFDRLAGTVTHHSRNNKATIIDFFEIKAFIRPTITAWGKTCYSLILIQEKQNALYTIAFHKTRDSILLYWDFLKYFMNTNNPLPEIPAMEPFRFLDACTKHFDKTYHRDPYYYRNMSEETFDALRQRAKENCRRFYGGILSTSS